MKIAIRAGHEGIGPGLDPGAVGIITEAEYTIPYAVELASEFRQIPGIEVLLIHDHYGHISLEEGVAAANNWGADLFLSVHFNAGKGTGVEVESLAGDGTPGYELGVLICNNLAISFNIPNRGVKVHPEFYETRRTNMTGIIIEGGFVDTSTDAEIIANPANKSVYAQAVILAVKSFYKIGGEVPPEQPTPPTPLQIAQTPVPPAKPTALNFSYPNNAQVIGDDLYIRDANGVQIPGRYVSNGDKITVLDVSYSKQLALVEYPTGAGVRSGYVKNIPSLIKYFYEDQWHNGSTSEPVYDENGARIGTLNPRETATPIFRKNGRLHVVYSTDKGHNTKSGYVGYSGGFGKF